MQTNMIDFLRYALYGTLIVLVFFLIQEWGKDHPKVPAIVSHPMTDLSQSNNYVPDVAKTETQAKGMSSTTTLNAQILTSYPIIRVKTDVQEVEIDPVGGNIIQVKLLQYPDDLHSKTPIVLLNNLPNTRYIAQSGLISDSGPDTAKGQGVYTPTQTEYILSENQNELPVKLTWKNNQGIVVEKIFNFKRNDYEIDVSYQITNQSQQAFEGNLYLQLMRKNTPPPTSKGFVNLATYFGAAISSPEKHFQKVTFKEMDQHNLNQSSKDGWAAMIQHYFISAWVPDKDYTSQYFSRVTPDGLYTIGLIGPKITISPGNQTVTHAKFYAGPSITDRLEKVAPELQLTIDYGWFWFISIIIFWMMQKTYDVIGNWGWSIVIVTLIIKLIFYHLSAKSYRSMGALKKLQPKIAQLKERFGEDKQKFTQATLELYKKEKVNPMSGCLPILVQIPVFIGLYWVLIESVELRQAPFILWIQDLSSKDPYYILPILMGLSMFLQQRLNPPPADPTQAKVMMFMPVIFTLLFINFPAGLMLYWLVNNILSFLQQWFIMYRTERLEKAKK